LVSRELLLHLEFNKPNKQNVYEINLLKNSTLHSLRIIVDTLIDIGIDIALCATFLFLTHFDVICDPFNNETTSPSFLRADSQQRTAKLTVARRKQGRVV